VQITVLLRQIETIRKGDLDESRFDAGQLCADEIHYRLFCETLFDFFREGGITWFMGHEQV
jgi:hypothetical protein